MSRPVRIALTLFLSATVLVFLVRQRVALLQTNIDQGLSDELARSESQMILLGIIVAGGLAIAGFVIIIVAMLRSRRNSLH